MAGDSKTRWEAAYLSSRREELVSNAFATEAAPCAPIWLLPILRTRTEDSTDRHGLVTARVGWEAAYLTLVSVWLMASALAICLAPSAFRKFSLTL